MFSKPKNNEKINTLKINSVQDVTINNQAAFEDMGGAYIAKSLKVGGTLTAHTINISSHSASNIECNYITVNTKAYISGECVVNDLSNNVFIGSSTGYLSADKGDDNVGIGANALLGLSGNRNISIGFNSFNSLQGDDNTSVGYYSGYNANGYKNSFFGRDSGHSVDASNNTAVGYRSLYSGTSDNNTAIGYQAGYGLDSDNGSNVFVGLNAGYNISGNYDVHIGPSAGQESEGDYNVAIGWQAGSGSTGNNNIGIGTNAGYSMHGNYNNCYGYASGFQTIGEYNASFGHESGYSMNGSNNISVGRNSSVRASGNYNIGIGVDCNQDSNGENNILIGQESGVETIGSNNICVGQESGYQSTTGDNNIYIGSYTAKNSSGTNNNICIGWSCGQNASMGSNSIFMGISGGWSSKKTEYGKNIGIGTSAFLSAAGDYNTCIGGSSGNQLSGHSNICIGPGATTLDGGAGQTGTGSFLIGSDNICIGNRAGYNCGTNFNNNVIIGKYCCTGANNVDNSVYINFESTHTSLTSGQVLIGADIFGNGGGDINVPAFVAAGITHGGSIQHFIEMYDDNTNLNWYVGRQPGGVLALDTGASNDLQYDSGTGNITYVSSSRKYKTNITNISNSSWIYNLQPKQFNFKNSLSSLNYGFIAEELYDLEDEEPKKLVNLLNDEPDSIRYSEIIPFIVAELKKINNEMNELKSEVAELRDD